MNVRNNLEKIKGQIVEACRRSNRNPDEIQIIAVTKYVSVSRAKEAIDAGIVHIGENRGEGLLNKQNLLKDELDWHFIGSLQTRKVKQIVNEVDYIHSLDRLSLAEEINKRAESKVKCFVQVNTSGEESKHGLASSEVVSFVEELEQYKNIRIVGLMTMAPLTENEQVIRESFKKLKELQQNVQAKGYKHAPCMELSMGMSNDFEIAIEEGATFIRIGSSLVGNEMGGT